MLKNITSKHFRIFVTAVILTLSLTALEPGTFAQSAIPHYAKVDSTLWQWDASNDGITYIPVCWENPGSYSTERSWVQSAIANSWESAANVSFYGWGKCSSNSNGLRILIADTRSRTNAIGKACAVTHQTARRTKIAFSIHCRKVKTGGERRNLFASADEERIGPN